eukprot:1157888-Pelagomonas_calceolata.AAC.1
MAADWCHLLFLFLHFPGVSLCCIGQGRSVLMLWRPMVLTYPSSLPFVLLLLAGPKPMPPVGRNLWEATAAAKCNEMILCLVE